MRRVLLLLAWAGAAVWAQPAGYRVAGAVVNAITGAPVGGARVSISSEKQPDREATVVTGGTGEFVFEGVTAGKHSLVARARGYPAQHYGQHSGGPGVATVTGPEEDTGSIVFRLAPSAAISGRVVDEAGEPIAWARVQLFLSAVLGGHRRTVLRTWAWSNDAGEYRFPELGPGTYYVAATGRPWYAQETAVQEFRNASYPMVWYPNATDVRGAAGLALKAGQEATADFTLTAVPGGRLTVELEGSNKRTPAALVTAGFPGTEPVYRTATVCSPCRFASVAPGRYILRVAGASRDIDIGTTDVSIKVAAPVSPPLSGAVQVEPGKEQVLPKLVAALRDDAGSGGYVKGVKPDGSFSFAAVAPGVYRVMLAGTRECYLKRASAEGAQLRGRSITVVDGSPVKLTLAGGTDGGAVEGKVYRDGKPLAGAMAVLAPRETSPYEDDYHGFQTDSDGSFDFPGVRPGEYILFAVEDGSEVEYVNPDATRPFLAGGQAIRVEPHTKQQVRVDVYRPAGS